MIVVVIVILKSLGRVGSQWDVTTQSDNETEYNNNITTSSPPSRLGYRTGRTDKLGQCQLSSI